MDNPINIYSGYLPELPVISGVSDQLQQTEEWHANRRGRFTGSGIKKLMTTTQAYARKPWTEIEKLFHFGKTSYKYIYEKTMERIHGYSVEMIDTYQFQYGRKIEPVLIEQFLKDRPDLNHQEVSFVSVKGHEDYLGASPDGLCIGIFTNNKGVKYGFEGKASMTWGTFYDRTVEAFDDKHIDFWQVQTEMLALGVDRLFYVTAMPAKNPFDVLNSNDYDEYSKMIKGINVIEVEASKLHQDCIIHRAKMGDMAIRKIMNGTEFYQAILEACTEYDIGKP